jgi:hypothetical protein
MAQYAVLIYADDSAHALDATPEDTATCDEHADELAAGQAMLLAYALTPRDLARSVRASGVTQGPFVAGGPVVAGFSLLEASDLDAAVSLASTNPVLREGGGVEVRLVHSGAVIDHAATS